MNYRNVIIIITLALLITVPGVVLATEDDSSSGATFTNPLKGGIDTVPALISNVILWLVSIVGLLALLAIVWGGIVYIVSFGNEQRTQLAKRIIVWAVIGLIIVMLAYVIVAFVGQILGVTSPPP